MTKDYGLEYIIGSEEEEEEEESTEPTPEEKAEEEQGLAEVKADELKASIAEKYDIDPESESELLEKLVENETTHRTRLSKTIKQKISWRDKAGTKKPPAPKKPDDGTKPLSAKDVADLVTLGVTAALDGDRLKTLNLPEALETEVKELAKIRGISVGEAAKLPYIASRVEEIAQEERIKSGTPKRNRKGSYKTSIDPSKPLNSEDFDLQSEDGIKAWDEAKAARKVHRNKK